MKIHEPPMEFKDEESSGKWEEGLKKNSDGYGLAIYRFASEWATRMEAVIASEETPRIAILKHAKRLSGEADDEGITGFMYGAAVSILSAWWKHGEDLRQWHNLDTQIGDEGLKENESGGVLNPAILNIG